MFVKVQLKKGVVEFIEERIGWATEVLNKGSFKSLAIEIVKEANEIGLFACLVDQKGDEPCAQVVSDHSASTIGDVFDALSGLKII